jgi:hypothetical protein
MLTDRIRIMLNVLSVFEGQFLPSQTTKNPKIDLEGQFWYFLSLTFSKSIIYKFTDASLKKT